MIKNQLIKWIPINGIPDIFYLDSIFDGKDGVYFNLSCDLENEEKVLVIYFDSLFSYRVTNESYRLKFIMVHNIEKPSFFIVKDSSYISWFKDESFHVYQSNILHYIILTGNDIIDVISEFKPSVYWKG